MTTKLTAYNASLHRAASSLLSALVLVMVVTLIGMICP